MFSASWTGSVAYHSGQDIGQLVWADRNGNEVGTISSPSDYQPYAARLSRDDSALLAARRRAGPGTYDIWLMNLVRGNEQQLTSNRRQRSEPCLDRRWACHPLFRRQPWFAAALVPTRPCHRPGRTTLAAWQSTECHGRFSRRPCGHLCGTHARRVQDCSSCLWLLAHLRRSCCQAS